MTLRDAAVALVTECNGGLSSPSLGALEALAAALSSPSERGDEWREGWRAGVEAQNRSAEGLSTNGTSDSTRIPSGTPTSVTEEIERYKDAISCGKGGLRLNPPCGKCLACDKARLADALREIVDCQDVTSVAFSPDWKRTVEAVKNASALLRSLSLSPPEEKT